MKNCIKTSKILHLTLNDWKVKKQRFMSISDARERGYKEVGSFIISISFLLLEINQSRSISLIQKLENAPDISNHQDMKQKSIYRRN